MGKVCSSCGGTLTFRNSFELEGKPLCNNCLKRVQAKVMIENNKLTLDDTNRDNQLFISGEGAIGYLKGFAWLNLIVGIIGSIVIGIALTDLWGAAIGFAILLEGMFGCALFLVIASIAENLFAIRERISGLQNERGKE